MKALPWIIAGTAAGLAVYFLANQPGPQYSTGSDTLEDAAGKTALWGSKQRVTGSGGSLFGKAKEGLGKLTGNEKLQGEGAVDQAVGAVKDAAGSVAQAAGQTLHDLNR